MNRTPAKQTALKLILLIIGVVAFLTISFPVPANIGAMDFRPYWSSSYLLAHGQDFSDPEKMDNVEWALTGWNEPFTMYAWFAPTGNVILLPYTFFPFTRATYYWLLTNIAILFCSALLIWRNIRIRAWIPLIATFGFSMTLLSLIAGQVNTLEVLGLALFLFFSESRHDYAAGVSLALTTIKPHLVILTLPLLLLDVVRHKEWRILIGFVGALGVCSLILFGFYPAWPIRFWQLVTAGMNTVRETPTIPGLLVVAGESVWGKWIWLLALLLATVIWWKRGENWDRRTLIDVSILAGILVSPIGWSYDQVMLLFPLLRVLGWMVNGSLPRRDAIAIVVVIIVANAITFYQRILTPSEVWFLWVPLAVSVVYVFAWRRRQIKLLSLATNAA